MPWWAFFSFLILILFFSPGCTQSTEIPYLSKADVRPVERVLLDDRISASDLREILAALNEDHALDNIVRLSHRFSDEKLDRLALVIQNSVRDDLRLLPLLQTRIKDRAATHLANWLEREEKYPLRRQRRDFLFVLFDGNGAQTVFDRGFYFLHPALLETWDLAKEQSEAVYRPLGEAPASLSAKEIAADIGTLFTHPRFAGVIPAIEDLLRAEGLQDVYRGMVNFSLGKEGKNSFVKFEGLRLGLGRMLAAELAENQKLSQRDNQLDLLFYFAESASTPSGKFFKDAEAGLNQALNYEVTENTLQNVFAKAFSRRFQNEFARLAADRERLDAILDTSAQDKGIYALYQFVLASWKPILGDVEGATDSTSKLSIQLDAYVTARWLHRHMMDNLAKVNELRSRPDFAKQLWETPVAAKGIKVQFIEKNAMGEFVFPEKASMMEGTLPELSAFLERYFKVSGEYFSNFHYQIPGDTKSVSFASAFEEAVVLIDRQRKMLDGPTFSRFVLHYLMDRSSPKRNGDQLFEDENLLDFFNKLVASQSYERMRWLKSFVLEELGVGIVDKDLIETASNFFENSKQITALLQSVQSLGEFDKPAHEDLATPFEAYRSVLVASSPARVGWVSRILKSLSVAQVAGKDSETESPRFPLFYRGIQSLEFAKGLHRLSLFSHSQWEFFRQAFHHFSADDGGKAFFGTLGSSISAQPEGWASLWQVVDELKFAPEIRRVNWGEWSFLRDFTERDDHSFLIEFFQSATRAEWRDVVTELRRLEAEGTLLRVARLLSLIHDEQLQKLSEVLVLALETGEFRSVLRVADSLLAE